MKIVINRTDAIGDSLLTLPVCECLRENYPDAEIYYIASQRCVGLFDFIGSQDETWFIDRKESGLKQFFSLLAKMKKAKPDVYIHLGGSSIPSFIALLLMIPKRLGLVSKLVSWLSLNMGTRQKRTDLEQHEVQMNLDLLKPLNLNFNGKYAPKVEREKIRLDALKAQMEDHYKNDKKTIFIHPGMTGHTLNWPVKNYVILLNELQKKYPEKFQLVLSYTDSDAPYVEQFQQQLKETPLEDLYLFNGAQGGLKHYIECLSSADLFIGPSTGTTHIANILSIPTLAFYSPIKAQHSRRWRPYFGDEERLKVIEPLISCPERLECKGESCEHYYCMGNLEVGNALTEIEHLLGLKG
jgi:heptosyltransferase-3